jgi:hypothetical protein
MKPPPENPEGFTEKVAIKEVKNPERWNEKFPKIPQKDCDAYWMVKHSKAKVKGGAEPGSFKPLVLAIPMFGYKNHIGIDRAH